MSSDNRTTGKLVPLNIPEGVDVKSFLMGAGINVDDFELDEPDFDLEEIAILNGKMYQVVDKVEDRDPDPYYCSVDVNDIGVVEFDTYYYNGGSHWTEMVENALEGM